MNQIGLQKSSGGTYTITPCEVQFRGITVTLGNGIKRAFPKLNLQLNIPTSEYVDQFFIPEMKSVFLFSASDELSTKFIQDLSKFCSLTLHLVRLNEYFASNCISFNLDDDPEIKRLLAESLKPFEGNVNLSNQTVSFEEKLQVFFIVHGATLALIDKVLIETNQISSSSHGIQEKIHLEYTFLDYQPGGRFHKNENNSWRNYLIVLFVAILGYWLFFK